MRIRNLTIGKHQPKICVPVMGYTFQDLFDEAFNLLNVDFDMIEWRADYFKYIHDLELVQKGAWVLRRVLGDKPILFTFRTAKEGGVRRLHPDYYFKLNQTLAQSGLIDAVDLEFFQDEGLLKETIETAHLHGTKVVLSNHDFEKTPVQEDLLQRLTAMASLGGDIGKIAVMPHSSSDVLTILNTTDAYYHKGISMPIVAIGMGEYGKITRVSGELFGSVLTFAAAGESSAPGQLSVDVLRETMKTLSCEQNWSESFG